MKSQLHNMHGQLFCGTQTPVCLWFLVKNKHDGSVVGNEPGLAIMNLALRGIEADFDPENADTFHPDLHPDLRAA